MPWRGRVCALSAMVLLLGGCEHHRAKKPDPTKGTVTGIVICTDTGKPARFATVTLSATPKKDDKTEGGQPLPATETTITGLDGRFSLEAVEPGRYYAFATLEGYLDPIRGLDFTRFDSLANDQERELDAIKQWKDHLVEVTVNVHRSAELALHIERAAEIQGTVTFEDGSPAVGMHFQVSRKTAQNRWSPVGLALFDPWAISSVSDGHGHFSLTNLPTGEFTVCALMPADSQDAAPRICLGNTFRTKDAGTVKVHAGEIATGTDIEVPLNGLHRVGGSVTAVADGHELGKATIRLLYADDREKAREVSLFEDGSFSFEYVPEGKYILQVSGAEDGERKDPDSPPAVTGATGSNAKPIARYADKEIAITVLDNLDDVQIPLTAIPPDKLQKQ